MSSSFGLSNHNRIETGDEEEREQNTHVNQLSYPQTSNVNSQISTHPGTSRSTQQKTPFNQYRDNEIESLASFKSKVSKDSKVTDIEHDQIEQDEETEEEEEEEEIDESANFNMNTVNLNSQIDPLSSEDSNQSVSMNNMNASNYESTSFQGCTSYSINSNTSQIETLNSSNSASYPSADSPLAPTQLANTTSSSQSPEFYSTSYSRLRRTMNSYLKATNVVTEPIQLHNSTLNSTEKRNNNAQLVNTKSNSKLNNAHSYLKFHAKNKEFYKLLEAYKAIDDDDETDLKRKAKSMSPSMLHKLASIFKSNESYYATMLMPITDTYKLECNKNERMNYFDLSCYKRMKCNSNSSSRCFKRTNATHQEEQVESEEEKDEADEEEENEETQENNELLDKYNYDYHEEDENVLENGFNTEQQQQQQQQSELCASLSNKSESCGANNDEFFLCSLCMHCLHEPITLVCGCTFCKNCLKEYNSAQIKQYENQSPSASSSSMSSSSGLLFNLQSHLNETDSNSDFSDHDTSSFSALNSSTLAQHDEPMRRTRTKRKHHSQHHKSTLDIALFKCHQCHKVHPQNTIDYLKPNVTINGLINKYWTRNQDVRVLRNDIRNYFVLLVEKQMSKVDLDEFEYLFEQCYALDPSNHLILADLFLLNYFSESFAGCFKYAQAAVELKPNWPFAYFMQSIYYERSGKLNQLKENLLQCVKLDSSLDQLKLKLCKLITRFSINTNKKSELNEQDDEWPNQADIHSSSAFDSSYNQQEENKQTTSTLTYESSKYITVDPHLAKPSDFECILCYKVLHNPVTTPCGHSFCSQCLNRALDYLDKCPLCKNLLSDYLAERRENVTVFLDKLIKTYYPNDYDERKAQFQEELNELIGNEDEIPIFVCTLALPFVSCPLHIYEPRYRLMIRRAIETGKKQFGMCMYTEQTEFRFTEYGCLLDITDHQFTSDGRAIIATVGSRRFKVLRTFSKDGYNMAQVEWLVDQRVTDANERAELQQLHDEVYKLSKDMFDLIPDAQRSKINEIYGISEFPTPEADIQENDNGPMWHWFLLNILPLQNEFQYRFLVKSSLKERLCQLKKIVLYLIPQFEKSKHMRRCSSTTSSQMAQFAQQPQLPTQEPQQTQEQQQQQQQQPPSQAHSDEVQSNESTDMSTNSNSSLH